MKIKLNVLIYIIITTLNVTFKFNGVTVKPILKYILSLLWIAYTIPYIFKKKKENKITKNGDILLSMDASDSTR